MGLFDSPLAIADNKGTQDTQKSSTHPISPVAGIITIGIGIIKVIHLSRQELS